MAGTKYLTLAEIAADIGVTVDSARTYHKRATRNRAQGKPAAGDLPKPDIVLGGIPGWAPKTIERWKAKRPGTGGGRPRKTTPARKPKPAEPDVIDRVEVLTRELLVRDALTGERYESTGDAWNGVDEILQERTVSTTIEILLGAHPELGEVLPTYPEDKPRTRRTTVKRGRWRKV